MDLAQKFASIKIRSVTTPAGDIYLDLNDITKVLTLGGLYKEFDKFMTDGDKQVYTASLESDPTNQMRQMILAADYREFLKTYGN